jgi:hypothetical protein
MSLPGPGHQTTPRLRSTQKIPRPRTAKARLLMIPISPDSSAIGWAGSVWNSMYVPVSCQISRLLVPGAPPVFGIAMARFTGPALGATSWDGKPSMS